jgi:transcriptional regulator with XRE-family HTH domain
MQEQTNQRSAEISEDDADLRLLIRNSGLTARALATRIGVTESALSRWVRGNRTPLEDRVEALAQVLGTTPAHIQRAVLVSRMRAGHGVSQATRSAASDGYLPA